MAIFDFCRSGVPVCYGGSTILVQNPKVANHHLQDSGRTITVIPSNGGPSAYFNVLDGRYKIDPSGWNT